VPWVDDYDDPHPKVNPPSIAVCPSCGNRTPHRKLHREDYSRVLDETDEGPIWDECWWAILECQTCRGLSLYDDFWESSRKRWVARLVYPLPQRAPIEVPEEIRHLFDDAIDVSHRSPSLCAVGIRRCLEAVVQDRVGPVRNLNEGIRTLKTEGILPEQLIEMMNTARIIGNLGAHPGSLQVTADDVQVLTDFCLAVLEYTYVAPNKIRVIADSLANRKQLGQPVPSQSEAGAES
jgi:hypothetical protein